MKSVFFPIYEQIGKKYRSRLLFRPWKKLLRVNREKVQISSNCQDKSEGELEKVNYGKRLKPAIKLKLMMVKEIVGKVFGFALPIAPSEPSLSTSSCQKSEAFAEIEHL